jgi:hypothetical protein
MKRLEAGILVVAIPFGDGSIAEVRFKETYTPRNIQKCVFKDGELVSWEIGEEKLPDVSCFDIIFGWPDGMQNIGNVHLPAIETVEEAQLLLLSNKSPWPPDKDGWVYSVPRGETYASAIIDRAIYDARHAAATEYLEENGVE